jgi:site-specific recombinase
MTTKLRLGSDTLIWIKGQNMATKLDDKEIVSFEELLMSQVVAQEALTRLLVDKGIFTKEEFWRW